LISEKINHYATQGLGFDDLSLVVSYNLAWLYNSPAETPRHSFEDAVAEISRFLDGDFGPFHRIFLFIAVDRGRVLRIPDATAPALRRSLPLPGLLPAAAGA